MASPWVPPTNQSPNLRTALAYIYAMEQWDEQKLMDTFDQTLEHQILPRSLNRPMLYKHQYLSYFQGLHKIFQKPLKRTIHEVIESGDCIIIHASANGESVTKHEYANEYLIVLKMMASSTGDGSRKIGSVKEFVDSNASSSFFVAESQRRKDAEAKSKARYRR